MADQQRPHIRVSDTEREDALGKLGQHMTEGRLDIEEYGERTAKVATAKTRGEVLELFGDLPEPRPVFGRPGPVAARRPASIGHRIVPVLVPLLVVLAAVGLTVLLRQPFFLVAVVVFLFVQGGRWRHG